MLATAAITASGSIATGFGDGALKYAASYRSTHDRKRLEATLRVNLSINLVLGGGLAVLLWFVSPFAVHNLFKIEAPLQPAAVTVFRVGSAVLFLRSIESVFIAALRAHERYGPSVRINVLSRTAIVVTACLLVSQGLGIVAMMVATLVIVIVSMLLQAAAARIIINPLSLLGPISSASFSEVYRFGCYSWLQAVAGCVFCQADRLLIGVLLDTSAVAYYSVCVQAAQPIHGLIAAGLHFLLPHLSARASLEPATELRKVVLSVLQLNIASALILCVPIVVFSRPLLHVWIGAPIAQQAWPVLSIVAAAFGLLALNITGHYALLALGQVRLVAMLNLAGGAAMLAAILLLAPRLGVTGAAVGRLLYGPITLLMYWRLAPMLSSQFVPRSRVAVTLAAAEPEQ